jgi:hypothetical protein
MFESIQALVPAEWRSAYELFSAPLVWIPDFHSAMINLVWFGNSFGEVLVKRTLVMMPMLLVIVGVWSTMVSMYTLPFRSRRGTFMTSMLMAWWDAGRNIWFFWAGMVRLAVMLLGWVWSGIRLGFRLIATGLKGVVRSPLAMMDWTSRQYFQPGVPWVAFVALLLWSAVESTIFMYTLSPTMSEVLAGITGYEPNPIFMAPILWIFLFLLVLGSFACIQVFSEAIANRRITEIIQMAFVEAFVMFFEVIFLYRELVDAVTPWIAQTTNEAVQLGLVSTLLLASFGWIGVRGMTWFLFGRFGTPAVLSILSRETLTREGVTETLAMPAAQPGSWAEPIRALKSEIDWFKKEGKYVFELISLPVLQLLAAAVNFIVVVIAGTPVFALPFKSLNQVMAVTPRWPKNGRDAEANGVATLEPISQGGTS